MIPRSTAFRFKWERALRQSGLPPSTRLVLLALASYMDTDGTRAFPSQLTLARDTGLSDRTVRGHLARAIAEGWLVCIARGHRRGDGTTRSNSYAAKIPDHCTVEKSTGGAVPVDNASTGEMTQVNRQQRDAQPETEYRLPNPFDQPPPTNGTALVDKVVQLIAIAEVAGEDDPLVKSPVAVATARVRAGRYEGVAKRIAWFAAIRSDLDDAVSVAREWNRPFELPSRCATCPADPIDPNLMVIVGNSAADCSCKARLRADWRRGRDYDLQAEPARQTRQTGE